MIILIATENPAKIVTYSIPIIMSGNIPKSLSDLNIEKLDIDEDSTILSINSQKKAIAYTQKSKQIVFATDEGFFVDCYPKKVNDLIMSEPRRLGEGRRLSDEEVIEKHNSWLKKYSKNGFSNARHILSISIALKNGKVFSSEFIQEKVLYIRENGFPTVKQGYPLDSQSKDIYSGKFICDLTKQELIKSLSMRRMAQFIKEIIKNNN